MLCYRGTTFASYEETTYGVVSKKSNHHSSIKDLQCIFMKELRGHSPFYRGNGSAPLGATGTFYIGNGSTVREPQYAFLKRLCLVPRAHFILATAVLLRSLSAY